MPSMHQFKKFEHKKKMSKDGKKKENKSKTKYNYENKICTFC